MHLRRGRGNGGTPIERCVELLMATGLPVRANGAPEGQEQVGCLVMNRIAGLLLIVLACGSPTPASGGDDRPKRRVADPKLQAAVNAAIVKGVAYLRKAQREDGSWRYGNAVPSGWKLLGYGHEGSGGLTGLALYALSASGVTADDSAIKKGLKWAFANPAQYALDGVYATYSVSLLALALTRIDAKANKKRVHALARCIEDGALPTAGWGYQLLDRKGRRKHAKRVRKFGGQPSLGDLSNTQFAVLALWAAESTAGHKVRKSTWKATRRRLSKLQLESGGWSYSMDGKGVSRASMTAAGVVSYVCAHAGAAGGVEHLPAARASEQAKKGLSAFTRAGKQSYDDYYFAYSVERLGTVLARPSADWYPAGARALLKSQDEDGRWSKITHGDSRQVYETALALLFLSRATAATVTGK